jgi:hypothetical protein
VDPSPADAPAGVLAGCQRLAATAAALPGGTGTVTLPAGRLNTGLTETDRARAGHGHPRTPRAKMLQMRLTYPLANRHPRPAGCLGVPAFTLSHLVWLQSPYAGLLSHRTAAVILPARWTPDRRRSRRPAIVAGRRVWTRPPVNALLPAGVQSYKGALLRKCKILRGERIRFTARRTAARAYRCSVEEELLSVAGARPWRQARTCSVSGAARRAFRRTFRWPPFFINNLYIN